ncbi:MAG: ABC transporter ATP-binding protein [Negativicutes bacterium]
MIECRNIVKEYWRGFWQRKAERVLSGISLSLHDGETYAVCGLSGSGKSTLGRVLLGLIPATGGEIFYDGKELQEILRVPSERKEFRRRHQILFQDPQGSLYPDFPIRRLMEEPYRVHRSDLGAPDWTRIDECLRRVGLDGEILDRYPAQLSGGQLQRVCLARLLLLRPSFLVLDEPTAMLDPTAQEEILRLLKELQRAEGLTYFFVSHDLDLVRYMADTVGILHEGVIIEEGAAKTVLSHPRTAFTQELVQQFSQ